MGVLSLLAGTVEGSHFLLCQPLFSKADPYEPPVANTWVLFHPPPEGYAPVLSPLQLPVSPAASGLYESCKGQLGWRQGALREAGDGTSLPQGLLPGRPHTCPCVGMS